MLFAAVLALTTIATDATAVAVADTPPGRFALQPGITLGTGGVGDSLLPPAEQTRRAVARLHDHPRGDALNHLADAGKHPVITDARSPRFADASVQAYTPVTWEECAGHTYDNEENSYWYRDKFNFCRFEAFKVTYRELQNGTLVEVGHTNFVLGLKATAVDRQNAVSFDMRMGNFADDGKTYKEWPLSIQLSCDNADPSRTSTCTEPNGPTVYRNSVAFWQAAAGTDFSFTKTMTTTATSDTTYKAEMRGFLAAGLFIVLESPIEGPETTSSPSVLMRCDSAAYVTGSKCVAPDATSVLRFSASDPTLSESAQLIRDAQTDITLTKPGIAGKRVPGVLNGAPLHRLYSAYDFNNDIKASRRRVPKTCRLYWGPKYTVDSNGNARQCDEYPFATTYENAARVKTSTVFDYAVRAIKKEHNETAGRIYGTWLGYDHILDGDPFYVEIVP
ncbi:NucA/NucB deoxyribonuclease domain-containing protein [Amycolatopsis nalaikhensis]|uniref:Deoxyribonuclease NucA/NucB domain-containing protein n=1 Tax=Amycolatopsis nalaikhensis TaxID=715472 RepID=A0ABY8X957_9PSEU|nr:hypothetical protein [Amycolatopsis sp. 2-2]WIV52929.1 hypothetical protein QP939_28745 [Amycolatopsis sp. 2-2]